MSDSTDEWTPLLSGTVAESGTATTADTEVAQNGAPGKVSVKALAFIVLPIGIGIFLSAMDGTVIVSTYASIGSEFNQLQNVSWIATSYMLTLTCFQPLYGKMSDIFGRKSCLLFAYAVFAVGCLFCGFARSLPELVGARALAGIGGGGMTTVASIIMSDIVPLRQRGTWQGILNIIYTTGSAAGAPIGGFLTDGIGWRWAFIVQVPIALAAIITVSLTLRLPTRESEAKTGMSVFRQKLARVDFAGAFFLITSVFFLLVALDRGSNIAWSDTYTLVSSAAFVILGSAFIFVEFAFAKEPLAPKRIITQPSLLASYLCNFFMTSSGMSGIYNVSLYLQAVLGKTPHEVGLWVIPTILGSLFGSLSGGLVIQSTGKFFWITFVSCMTAFIGSLLIVGSAGVIGSYLVPLIIGWTLAGAGNGSGITTSLISLIATAGPEDQAIATAVSYLFRSLGSVFSLSLGSGILQVILRSALRSRLSEDVKDSELEEIIRRVRESMDSIDDIPGAKESYEKAIQGVLWFSALMSAFAWISSCWIKEKQLS